MGLDLKAPPDLVALVVAGLMWLVSRVTPSVALPAAFRAILGVALVASGVWLVVAARAAFARAATTFSPVAPERSARLVTTGIYRFSRNPMYVGMQLILLAFAVWLSDPVTALVALGFAVYIDLFQIRPEEQVLRGRFGSDYDQYMRRVRRWV